MEEKEYKKIVYLVAVIAALGGLLFGLDQGFIAFALSSVEKVYSINTHQGEAYTAILATGGILGTLFSGFFNKYIGRKNSLVLAGFIFTVMSLISAFLPSFEVLKWARFFLGFAVGLASFSVPLYLAETAPKDIRGKVGTMFQLMITIGIFLVAVVNYAIVNGIDNSHASLSLMFIFLLVFSFLMFALCLVLPKSPRWLLSRGKLTEARVVLGRLWHTETAINKEIEEFNSINANIDKKPILEIVTKKFFLKILVVGILLQMFQQLVGINFIIYYAPTALGYAGITGIFGVLLLYFLNMAFTLPAIKFVDKWGRKKLLYIGSVLMLITMLTAALSFYMLDALKGTTGGEVTFYQYLLLVSFAIYIIAFASTWGPVVWLMCSEIFPFQSKEVGMTITTMVNWTFAGVVSYFSLSIMKDWGNFATPLVFAVFCLLSIVFLKICVPETKGVSLETIEKNLVSGRKLRDLGQE